MKKEEKELLLKDLCCRLPYGVKVAKSNIIYPLTGIDIALGYVELAVSERISIEEVRPYLRPMSSMTEEERKMVCTMNALSEAELDDRIKYRKMYVNSYTIETFDLFNSNHLDYRGLIPMGLAIKVTEKNNPYKE